MLRRQTGCAPPARPIARYGTGSDNRRIAVATLRYAALICRPTGPTYRLMSEQSARWRKTWSRAVEWRQQSLPRHDQSLAASLRSRHPPDAVIKAVGGLLKTRPKTTSLAARACLVGYSAIASPLTSDRQSVLHHISGTRRAIRRGRSLLVRSVRHTRSTINVEVHRDQFPGE